MGRRGGFAHNYDAAATRRFLDDGAAVDELGADISAALTLIEATIDRLADDLVTSHGLHADVARLLVTQRTADSVDFLRWVKAGEARAAGVPIRGLMDALGYASPTSISRQVAAIDHVATVRTRVDATGEPEDVFDDRGYTLALHPRHNAKETVAQARKRGWLPADLSLSD